MARLVLKDPKLIKRLVRKGMISADVTKAAPSRKPYPTVCPLSPKEPAHILYQAIVRRFGRLYEGGEAVFELTFPDFKRKYRVDIALPAYKVCVEMDGWVHHGKHLSGFQRDREKSLEFERRGWRVIRFSNQQIRQELDDVLCAIDDILSHCTYRPELKCMVCRVAFDRSIFVQTIGNQPTRD